MSLFITFEGIEGCGKTTQMQKLGEVLKKEGVSLLLTREPGGTPVGDSIRRILLDASQTAMVPLCELFLYGASRAQHVEQIIQPALKRGVLVLCDRFTDATLAYQGFGRGIDLKLLETMNGMATKGTLPHKTVLFDLDPQVGLERAMERIRKNTASNAEDRFEREALAFHQRVREGYLSLARDEPQRFSILDASRSVDEIHHDVLALIRRFLKP